MRHLYVFLCLLVAFVVNAQYTGPGFYRVHNVSTDRYISIKGTHFEKKTTPDAFWACIKMLPAADQDHVSDAGSLIYIPRMDQTSLYAQGVSTYSLTGLLMDITESSEMHDGMVTYNAFTQYEDFPCKFRDKNGLTAGSGDKPETRWWIEPVSEESIESSYFGVQPSDEAIKDSEGMYWTSLCCDFPFLIPAEGGVEGAYTVREVVQDEDGLYYAITVKEYGQGEVVPAATPVLLKCEAAVASGNKLIPTGEIANNTTFPLVNGLLMGNYFSNFLNYCSMADYSARGEYIPEQSILATPEYLVLGVNPEGRMGFFPKAEGTYMDANTAWLGIDGLALDGVTEVYLYELLLGDANGDGQVDIKDVSSLIDYLLGGDTAKAGREITQKGADVNGDGAVDIKDVSSLIDRLLFG